MLVLSRRKNETLVMGQNGEIRVTILDISPTRIRIGIEAPADVKVNRKEVWLRIQAEEKGANMHTTYYDQYPQQNTVTTPPA